MTESEKQIPFTKCLMHETKKAATDYFKIVAAIIFGFMFLTDAVYMIFTFGETVVQFIIGATRLPTQILGWVGNLLFAGIAVIPWWIYAILLICSPPVVYATGICIQRRYRVDIGFCVAAATIGYGMGMVMGVLAAIIYSPYFLYTFLSVGTLCTIVAITGGTAGEKPNWKLKDN